MEERVSRVIRNFVKLSLESLCCHSGLDPESIGFSIQNGFLLSQE
jgi:hypothetical protein